MSNLTIEEIERLINEYPHLTPDQYTEMAAEVREKRDTLLAETDWWAVSDRTMTQAETDYRQALRDITTQEGFPDNITWPTKP